MQPVTPSDKNTQSRSKSGPVKIQSIARWQSGRQVVFHSSKGTYTLES